jgi:hypothetical protein
MALLDAKALARVALLLDLDDKAFRNPADCIVHVEGEEIVELYPFLREVTVETSRSDASTASLVFETRRDEHGRWSVQDRAIFAPWKKIVLDIGFATHSDELFRGYVREVVADYPAEAGAATFRVECQDDSLALDREQVRLTWGVPTPVSDAEIVKIIAGKHDLRLARPPEGTLANLALHQNSTDIQFLRARAEANGFELYFREGEMYFGPKQLDAEPQKAILVHAGLDTNCISLSVRSDGHLPEGVAFDLAPLKGQKIRRKTVEPRLTPLGREPASPAVSGLKPFTWLMSREGSFDEDELTARAQQKADDFSLRIRAQGELDGARYGAVLVPGRPVPVDGAGEWLGGIYYVDSVSHRIDTEGYRQKIQLLRNAYGEGASLR